VRHTSCHTVPRPITPLVPRLALLTTFQAARSSNTGPELRRFTHPDPHEMGASQSSTSASYGFNPNHKAMPTEESKRPRPYSLATTSKHIQLNSSYCTLYDGIISLVQDNKYADLLIICGSDRYPVHRAIVCPRSEFFEEHCAPREGERDYASPAKPTKIWIDPSDCESHVLSAVLTFLYTLDYSADGHQTIAFGLPKEVDDEDEDHQEGAVQGCSDDIQNDEGSAIDVGADIESIDTFIAGNATPSRTSSRLSTQATQCPSDPSELRNDLVFHVQMCAAGHRFGIASLCDVAKEKLEKRIASVVRVQGTELIGCIREVYRQGHGGKLGVLREVVVKSARSRFRVLKTCEGWDDLIIDVPEFAAEMLRRL